MIISKLFDALEKPNSIENPYIMRCIKRFFMIVFVHDIDLCFDKFGDALETVRDKELQKIHSTGDDLLFRQFVV